MRANDDWKSGRPTTTKKNQENKKIDILAQYSPLIVYNGDSDGKCQYCIKQS
jgi:hypothetical protein